MLYTLIGCCIKLNDDKCKSLDFHFLCFFFMVEVAYSRHEDTPRNKILITTEYTV